MNKPTPEELAKINSFARTELKADEVYTFKVALCNNDIDRDFEKFTVEALSKMAPLFVGRTGIFDHSMRSSDQKMRIFETWVAPVDGKTTKDGEPFTELNARVYMLNTPENKSLIEEIEGGIKKEVSVSCSMKKSVCSICGKDVRKGERCNHRSGQLYDGKLCYKTLEEPSDAYEFSFVAVPAQPEAGVRKSFIDKRIEEGREYRTTSLPAKLTGTGDFVETLSCKLFDSAPRLLWEDDARKFFITEAFAPDALKNADTSDCVLQIDHSGRVYSRTGKGDEMVLTGNTLHLKHHGAQAVYDSGANDMEVGFRVAESTIETVKHGEYIEYIRVIKTIDKIFDVSAVTPGSEAAEKSVRALVDGVIDMAEAERLRAQKEAEQRLHRLKLKMKFLED